MGLKAAERITQNSARDLLFINRIKLVRVQTVRRQRQDAGKCSGADGDHHEQAHAKAADGCGQDNSERFRERAALTPSAALISTKTFRRVEPNLTQESDESRIGMQWPKVARKADAMDGPGVLGHSALEPVNRFIVFA